MRLRAEKPSAGARSSKSSDLICVFVILAATLVIYAPSLIGGKVLLPADIIPIMRPWGIQGQEKLPKPHLAHTQLHGPIFEYYSWRHYARERVRAGEIPLWNPNELGGNVLLANSQSAVLYPPNILLYLLPLHIGINLVTAVHTFFTGVFMFGLMRQHRLQPIAALTSALVWMFCGVQMGWLEFQTPTAALCWLPGILLAWEVFATRRSLVLGLAGCGTGIALALLAGHLHFAFYVILAFLLYAAMRSILPLISSLRKDASAVRRALLTVAGAMALGIGLSACTLLPVIEMGKLNFRSGKSDYASTLGLRMPPVSLLTLVQPNLFGSPRDYVLIDDQGTPTEGYAYWGPFNYVEYACYIGIPGLILALVGGSIAFQKRHDDIFPSQFFILLTGVGLLLALGTPLCAVLFYGVPGYSQFNATGRAICLACFGLAALAGVGLNALLSGSTSSTEADVRSISFGKKFWWAVGTVAIAGLAAFPGMGLAYRTMFTDHWLAYESSNLRHFVIFAALTATAGGLLLRKSLSIRTRQGAALLFPVLALADLWLIYAGFNPQIDAWMLGYPTETTTFLQSAAPNRVVSLETPEKGIRSFIVPNYNAVVGLREVQGANSLHTQRYHRLLEKVVLRMDPARGAAFGDPNTIHVPNISHPFFDLLNVKYVTTLPGIPCPDPTRLEKENEAELTIWKNRRALGPAWIVGRAERVSGLDGFMDRISDSNFDPKTTALVEGAPPPLEPSASSSPVNLLDFQPHKLTYEVNSPGAGLLVTSEIAFPGWAARVDGTRVPMLTADHILRCVPIERGAHRVVVEYRPASYLIGLYFTCMSIGVLFGAVFGLRRSAKKPIKGVPVGKTLRSSGDKA